MKFQNNVVIFIYVSILLLIFQYKTYNLLIEFYKQNKYLIELNPIKENEFLQSIINFNTTYKKIINLETYLIWNNELIKNREDVENVFDSFSLEIQNHKFLDIFKKKKKYLSNILDYYINQLKFEK